MNIGRGLFDIGRGIDPFGQRRGKDASRGARGPSTSGGRRPSSPAVPDKQVLRQNPRVSTRAIVEFVIGLVVVFTLIAIYGWPSTSKSKAVPSVGPMPTIHSAVPSLHDRALPVIRCSAYLVITVRGTNEVATRETDEQAGDANLLGPVAEQVVATLGNAKTMDLDYPASLSINSSRTKGVDALGQLVAAQAQTCPGQRFVLMGYSQGALVITDFLSQGADGSGGEGSGGQSADGADGQGGDGSPGQGSDSSTGQGSESSPGQSSSGSPDQGGDGSSDQSSDSSPGQGSDSPPGQSSVRLSAEVSERIDAIVFYGDPGFVGSEPFNAGDFDPSRNGVLPRQAGSLNVYASRIRSFCVSQDWFCQAGDGGSIARHLEYYRNGMREQGAAFVVETVTARAQGSATG